MTKPIDPQFYARVGGVLYLLVIALGMSEEAFIRGRILVAGDAAATVANLQNMEMLWRTGIAMELLLLLLSIALAVVLYVLIRPVHEELALMAFAFNVIAIAVECAYSLQLVEALFPIGGSASLGAFTPGQLQAMVILAMKAHVFGFGIALLLFAPFLCITGHLIFASGYLPKPVGILYQLAGLAYLCNGFVLVLAPQLAGGMFLLMAIPAFLGETSFAVWLLVKGVGLERWRALMSAPAA